MAARDHFRSLARRSIDLRATLRADGGIELPARLVDLGLGGACVELSGAAGGRLSGDRVELEVMAPHLWDPLRLDGRIVWNRDLPEARTRRIGLRFEHQSGSVLRALVELLGAEGFD
jgi:hypothetical protein